ncbi:MAG: UDP-N-acetylglucosamine 1-carboxyvinyltransferase [Clostridia bacterium]|nr:UDP-N-acetylglucosamine 1-carboxyvinyltransferase [Clostridia bacterium]
MNKLVIDGGFPLKGEITVQGAKNAVLPILAASIMAEGESVIHNCPKLRDVEKTGVILEDLGCTVRRERESVYINPENMNDCRIDEKLMREMRSSIIFLGAILTVWNKAEVGMPGGCPIGLRPIDLHIKALKQMGVRITEEYGYIKCECDRLKGAEIHLDFPSVGATENIMLAAVKAEGTTVITNAAREPEIVDLAGFLTRMGAKIKGAGSSVIVIDGVKRLNAVEYTIMPDRIVAQTYLISALITGGEVLLKNAIPSHINSGIAILNEMGAKIHINDNDIYLKSCDRIKNIHIIKTMPYPGFATDIQSPFMALASVAQGTSVFVENMFENRFRHVDELVRMGADIKVEGRSAVVRGVKRLHGANVEAYELRGGAALVMAGLNAEGRTEISGIEFIDRGYQNIEGNLSKCGAKIKRIHIQ